MHRFVSRSYELLTVPSHLRITKKFWKKEYPKFYSFISRNERLEELANSNPADPNKQARYLEYLNEQKRFAEVITRVNSGQYAQNPKVTQEYNKAILLATAQFAAPQQQQQQQYYASQQQQQSHFAAQQQPQFSSYYANSSNTSSFDDASHNHSSSASSSSSTSPVSIPIGSEQRPLYVQQAGQKGAQKLFSTLLQVASVVLVILALTYLLPQTGGLGGAGEKGAGGAGSQAGIMRLLGNYTYEPVKESKKLFKDIKGVDECMDEIKEIVEFLKNPKKFEKLGAKLPRGVLLVGSPGVGKTLLAKAISGEAGVPFFYVSGSEFDEVFVGVGAGRVRGLFDSARKHAPCIIFIDEIDALGSKRREREVMGGAKQTINQLLAELDGFKPRDGIIVIGATNFPGSLDQALTRPGRFDKVIQVPLPDIKGREDILQLYSQNKPFDASVNFHHVAQRSIGFSGADLENLVNEAAIRAAIRNANAITKDDIEYAFDRIVLGLEHKTLTISPEEKRRTAYHEAGHAIITLCTDSSKLHKVTITPRGRSLGATHNYPSQTKVTTKKDIIHQIQISLGGLVAEEIVYGAENIATGASSDLRGATKMARDMVVMYGMSSNLGALDYSGDYETSNWSSIYSPDTKREIDLEIRNIINNSHGDVRQLLTKYRKELNALAEELLRKETVDAAEVMALLKWKPTKQ